MEFLRHTLPNGLEVIAESNDQALSLALGFFVQAGARDEDQSLAGVSHFLEHMVFKGTPTRSADDVNREFDELGAHHNAFTSEESTVYYASLLPEHQSTAFGLLADIMRPSLREDDFNMEKKVILEEIEMYLDQPPFGMDDQVKRLCFGSHPISHSVLGTADTVGGLTSEQMRSYFNERYSPNNIVFAAAGKVDFDALVAQAENLCGDWQRQTTTRQKPIASGLTTYETVVRSSATQQYALLLSPAPAGESADRYAAKLLAMVLGDDSGSRMYWDLIDPGLAESAHLGHYDYQGVGMFYTWLCSEPEDIEQILQMVINMVTDVCQTKVTEEELAQAKSKLKSRVVLSSERPRSRLFNIGAGWAMRGDYRSVRDDLEAIDRVTTDDLLRVAQAYPIQKSSGIAIGPRSEVQFP